MPGWWLSLSRGPFKPWAGSIVGLQSFRDAPFWAQARNPATHSTAGFPRSRQEARPGMTDHVSTRPVVEPLAAESLRPCGSARYDCELISISREAVRLNSLASLPSAARYSDIGSASAEAISFTALS